MGINILHIADDMQELNMVRIILETTPTVAYNSFSNNIADGMKIILEELPDYVLIDDNIPVSKLKTLAKAIAPLKINVIILSSSGVGMKDMFSNPTFYMAKPFSQDTFENIVAQKNKEVVKWGSQKTFDRANHHLTNDNGGTVHQNKLVINTHEAMRIIEFDQITFIKAAGAYTIIHLENGSTVKISRNLRHTEQLIKHEKSFVKVHRSFIVNTNHLLNIYKEEGKNKFFFSNGLHFTVRNYRKSNLLERLRINTAV